jgi:hypothetical protein
MAIQWALIYDPTGRLRLETGDFGTSGIHGVAMWSVGATRRRDVYATAHTLAGMLLSELERRRLLDSDETQA